MAATTKAQRMQAIREAAERERAEMAEAMRQSELLNEEINKQIAKRNRQRYLKANSTVVPSMSPDEEDVIDRDIRAKRIADIENDLGRLGETHTMKDGTAKFGTPEYLEEPGINPEFAYRAMLAANANGDNRVTPQTLAGTPSILDRMFQWGDDIWEGFFNDESGETLARAKQDISGPSFGEEGYNYPEYTGPEDEGLRDVTVVPFLKTPRLMQTAWNAGQQVLKDFKAPTVPGPSQIAAASRGAAGSRSSARQNPNIAPVNTQATGQQIVPRNMQQVGPRVNRQVAVRDNTKQGVPMPGANWKPPHFSTPIKTSDVLASTVLNNQPPIETVVVTPPLGPKPEAKPTPKDIPQNGGHDKGGYPDKPKVSGKTLPQRQGYKVVKTTDGSPVKSGNGYMWTKDYQHEMWGDS